ncbi:hypothetical protein [Shimazuella alba]|uniref:Uncharacterized protein n=1 Tax=Shimazuella alba TaxID=2690964 RepID=A0A6I4VXA7_9BACL|nr:hypothetical protein [Shimazuella alba]MXQ52662.1 hypothetical protein [Shimazuella alba]
MFVLARIVDQIANAIKVTIKAMFLMFVGGLMVIVAQDHPELVDQIKTEVLLPLGQWKDTVVNFDYSQWIQAHKWEIVMWTFLILFLAALIDETLPSNRRRKSAVVFDYSQQACCQCRCWCHSGPTGAVTLPQSQTRKY